jgi:hypothetical protein
LSVSVVPEPAAPLPHRPPCRTTWVRPWSNRRQSLAETQPTCSSPLSHSGRAWSLEPPKAGVHTSSLDHASTTHAPPTSDDVITAAQQRRAAARSVDLRHSQLAVDQRDHKRKCLLCLEDDQGQGAAAAHIGHRLPRSWPCRCTYRCAATGSAWLLRPDVGQAAATAHG